MLASAGHVLAQVVIRRPATTETLVRSGTSPSEICDEQNDPSTGPPQALHVSPVSVTPPVLHVSCSYKDKRTNPVNLQKGIPIRILCRVAGTMFSVVFIKFVLPI
jgi:hypothetical protein